MCGSMTKFQCNVNFIFMIVAIDMNREKFTSDLFLVYLVHRIAYFYNHYISNVNIKDKQIYIILVHINFMNFMSLKLLLNTGRLGHNATKFKNYKVDSMNSVYTRKLTNGNM